jgi:hypothetical protein
MPGGCFPVLLVLRLLLLILFLILILLLLLLFFACPECRPPIPAREIAADSVLYL